MARLFDGTNDSLQAASINLSAYTTLTVAFWLWWDAFSSNDDLAMEFTADVNSNAGGFIVNPNDSFWGGGSKFGIAMNNQGVPIVSSGGYIERPSAAAWHHYMIRFNTGDGPQCIKAVFVDGAQVTFTHVSGDANAQTFANSTLNIMSRNNTSLFGAGRMAHLALWGGVLLNNAAADVMYQGYSPNTCGEHPTHYWRLEGYDSPETEEVSGAHATVNGAIFTDGPPDLMDWEQAIERPGGNSLSQQRLTYIRRGRMAGNLDTGLVIGKSRQYLEVMEPNPYPL